MKAHTPGPWEVQGSEVWATRAIRFNLTTAGTPLIARVCEHKDAEGGFPYEANARLIASAPELLEALQRIEAHLSAIGTPRDSRGRYHKDGEWTFDEALPRDVDACEVKSAFEVVRTAISRATGEGE